MWGVKQIIIKNRTYYFYNDIIDVKNVDASCQKLTKNRTKTLIFTTLDTSQLDTSQVDDSESIYSVNPLHLRIDQASGYIKEKNGNKNIWLYRWKQKSINKIQWSLEWN